MSQIEIEAQWFASLDKDAKAMFLARLGHGITIAGRYFYVAGCDEVENPAQLRRINEIQHRVLSCLLHLLSDDVFKDMHQTLANNVLNQSDIQLQELMFYTWEESKVV